MRRCGCGCRGRGCRCRLRWCGRGRSARFRNVLEAVAFVPRRLFVPIRKSRSHRRNRSLVVFHGWRWSSCSRQWRNRRCRLRRRRLRLTSRRSSRLRSSRPNRRRARTSLGTHNNLRLLTLIQTLHTNLRRHLGLRTPKPLLTTHTSLQPHRRRVNIILKDFGTARHYESNGFYCGVVDGAVGAGDLVVVGADSAFGEEGDATLGVEGGVLREVFEAGGGVFVVAYVAVAGEVRVSWGAQMGNGGAGGRRVGGEW